MPILGVIASSGDRNVPDAPTIGTATNVPSGRAFNNGRADVTFTAPVYTGGTPITGYTVTSSPGGFTGTGAASPISVTGLQSNTAYTFTVTATNAIGTSAPSAASNSITATTVPQAPTIGTATDLGTGTSVSVAFTANATGGSAITGFTATSSPGSITGTGGSSPITVNGLTAGTAYTFTVTATNANGTSAPSAASNSVTPSVPGSYESIASSVPTATSSVTFSSIPSTYKHLQIRITAINTVSDFGILMRLNGDATSGNYNESYLRGTGSAAQASYSGGNQDSMAIAPSAASATNPTTMIIDIFDYQSTVKNKTVSSLWANDRNTTAGKSVGLASNLYKSTAAINSVTIFTSGSTQFTTGTVMSLYGIKG